MPYGTAPARAAQRTGVTIERRSSMDCGENHFMLGCFRKSLRNSLEAPLFGLVNSARCAGLPLPDQPTRTIC